MAERALTVCDIKTWEFAEPTSASDTPNAMFLAVRTRDADGELIPPYTSMALMVNAPIARNVNMDGAPDAATKKYKPNARFILQAAAPPNAAGQTYVDAYTAGDLQLYSAIVALADRLPPWVRTAIAANKLAKYQSPTVKTLDNGSKLVALKGRGWAGHVGRVWEKQLTPRDSVVTATDWEIWPAEPGVSFPEAAGQPFTTTFLKPVASSSFGVEAWTDRAPSARGQKRYLGPVDAKAGSTSSIYGSPEQVWVAKTMPADGKYGFGFAFAMTTVLLHATPPPVFLPAGMRLVTDAPPTYATPAYLSGLPALPGLPMPAVGYGDAALALLTSGSSLGKRKAEGEVETGVRRTRPTEFYSSHGVGFNPEGSAAEGGSGDPSQGADGVE